MALIAIDAEAWSAIRNVLKHTLFKGAKSCCEDEATNGSVSITYKMEERIALKSTYYVKLTLTQEEIDKMYRLSLAGSTKRLIQPLEAKPAGTGGFVRRL